MAKVLVSINDGLLRRIDRCAAQLGLTRSAFVARLAMEHLDGTDRAVDPAAVRSVARARAACREGAAHAAGDATQLVRQMRDER